MRIRTDNPITRAGRALLTVLVAALGIGIAANPATAAPAHPSAYAWASTRSVKPGWELDSPNGLYRAIFQGDHNLVVYHGGKATWSSKTNGASAPLSFFASDQKSYFRGSVDVQFYCFTTCDYPVGKTSGNGVNRAYSAYHLNMQNDGNFVEYTGSSGGAPLWATGTNGK